MSAGGIEERQWPPPGVLPPPPGPPPDRPPKRRANRPAVGLLVVVTFVFRFGRDTVGRIAMSRWGAAGLIATLALGLAVIVLWQVGRRWRVRRRAGVEFTTEDVVDQIRRSGLPPAAFPEDGTLLGASLLVVNQRAKILEVQTEYEVFGSAGQRLGSVRQIGQSRGKQVARILTSLDQFFTHHFDVHDAAGRVVLRLTRPRKVFLTKLHVFDGTDRFVGTIRQRNVFWKIRFELTDAAGNVVGHLRAENVRAWDFCILDRFERPVAELVKTWEGWAQTAFTRADRYAVRIGEPLAHPLRELTIAAALAADLALKQDTRGVL